MSKKRMSKELFDKVIPRITEGKPLAYGTFRNVLLNPEVSRTIKSNCFGALRDVTAVALLTGDNEVFLNYGVRNPEDAPDKYRTVVELLTRNMKRHAHLKVSGDDKLGEARLARVLKTFVEALAVPVPEPSDRVSTVVM